MVGTALEMLLNPFVDCLRIAPRDHGVQKFVGRLLPVFGLKPLASPVLLVVYHGQVHRQAFLGDGSGFMRVCFQDNLLLHVEFLVRTQNFSSFSRMSRSDVVGMGAVRHLARQVLDMDGPLPAALFAESPHLSDAELDELDAIINAAAADTEGKA